jgi:hypothetical protein
MQLIAGARKQMIEPEIAFADRSHYAALAEALLNKPPRRY